MRMRADWINAALCRNDIDSHKWLSSNIDDINYAKDVCRRCTVRMECMTAAIYEKDSFIGVNGGMSEIEYLMSTWEEVSSEDETNWGKSDSVIHRLFRIIA